MHEIGIVQGTLEMAEQTAQANSASRIDVLHMRVGVMTGVVPEALQFAFEALREGTIAAQARLEIEIVPAEAWCAACQIAFPAESWAEPCPECRQQGAKLRHGLELELAFMEVS
jgi:hydrogenase nickel incorporation protein HypA/HybF